MPRNEPIHRACERGDVAALRRELANGVLPNVPDRSGRTPAYYCCSHDCSSEKQVACLNVLVEAGADLNVPTTRLQKTPLHRATQCCNTDVVAALLKAGADVNRGAKDNITPLHCACWRNSSDCEPGKVLIRNGADVNVRDRFGTTPLDAAILYRQRLVPILLRAGAALHRSGPDAYIRKVIAAGGFGRYEKDHLNALSATFARHFPPLPLEVVRLVVKYAFHLGYY